MKTALPLLFALTLAGCAHDAREITASQTPGRATGAGASLIGPANSATPSTQTAEREVEYFEPDLVTFQENDSAGASRDNSAVTRKAEAKAVVTRDGPRLSHDRADTPPPRYVREKVTTTIGQHQDAAPLIRAASAASGWTETRWIGWLCILVGGCGWLYGVTHKETGYPVVFLKVAAIGVFLVIVGENPLWLFLLLIPAGFWFVQKVGLWRVLP